MFTPTCLEEIWKRLLGRKRNTRGPVPSSSSSHPWLSWLKQNQSLLFALAGAVTCRRFSSSRRVCFGSCKLEKQTRERKERNVWNFESGLSSERTHCLRGEASPFFFFWQSQLLIILWKVNTSVLSSDTFNGPKNNLHRHCRSKKKKKSCSFYPSKGKKMQSLIISSQ